MPVSALVLTIRQVHYQSIERIIHDDLTGESASVIDFVGERKDCTFEFVRRAAHRLPPLRNVDVAGPARAKPATIPLDPGGSDG